MAINYALLTWKLGALATCLAFMLAWNYQPTLKWLKHNVKSLDWNNPPLVMLSIGLCSIIWPAVIYALLADGVTHLKKKL